MDDPVYSITAFHHDTSSQTLFAGKSSGLYRSQDGGESWASALKSLEITGNLPVMALAQESSAERDRVAMPGIFAGVPGGILTSTDRGESWRVSRLSDPPPVISCLAVSPGFYQDGVVLAGSVEDGVFRSSDRGNTWTRWNFGLLDLNVFALAISPDFLEDETLFAGTETGIFRSTNGGRAWREVDFSMDLAPVLSLAISPLFTHDGLILAGTEANGLFLSRNGGKTWTPAAGSLEGMAVNAVIIQEEAGGQLGCLALADNTLWVSRDGGQTWREWETPVPEDAGISCVAAPQGLMQGARLLAGTVDGNVLWI